MSDPKNPPPPTLVGEVIPSGSRAVLDPIDAVLAEARRFPRLSAEEEHALAVQLVRTRDREAARRLILHHLWLVVAVAREYRRMSIDLLDLIQEGSLGLVEAVHRFDPFQGTRFATYARYWVRAYILRHLLANQRILDLGRTRAGRKLFFRLNKERADLEARGLDVTPMMLEDKLGVDRAEIAKITPILRADISIDRPIVAGEGFTMAETLADRNAITPADAAARSDLERTLKSHLDAFAATITDPRERVVWNEHLMSASPVTLSALGERYGVSKQRMGQIVDRIKRRCRDFLVSKLGPETQLGWLFDEG